MKHILHKLWVYIKPFMSWKVLIIYLPIWFIVSGWTYVFIYIGTRFHISWMWESGSAWAAFLWMPFTPEKLVTIPFCIFLYTKLFHESSPAFEDMYKEAKHDWLYTKLWFRLNISKLIKMCILLLLSIIVSVLIL